MPAAQAGLISIDEQLLNASIRKAIKGLDLTEKVILDARDRALALWSEQILGEAVERAPVGVGAGGESTSASPGSLRMSGTVDGPNPLADGIEFLIGFDKPYAAMRDKGGTIRPRTAKALFIPLRQGVRPGEPGLKQGVDFILVPGPMTNKQFVTQTGNEYLSGLLPIKAASAPRDIGRLMEAEMGRTLPRARGRAS